jgi:hypothetical protein
MGGHEAPFDVSPNNTDAPNGLLAWIKSNQQAGRNLYHHVAVGKVRESKLKKTDVLEVRALWVDCDPDPRRYEKSRSEILQRLREYHIRPSAIVDSGNGYQAYWFLNKPFVIDGNPARIAEFESYTRQIYHDFLGNGGDGCWSIDHLMRLPGTENLETHKKLAKGYPPGNRPAFILEWNEGTTDV